MLSILMATYNGEKFIEEQIISILNQSYQDFVIYISDDGSNDKTVEIINKYASLYQGKIILLEHDSTKKGGAKNNFLYLLDKIEDEYIMFSDQDDVWDRDKVLLSIKKIKELEKIYKKEMPIAIHTDLSIVDEKLKEINKSMYRAKNFKKIDTLSRLLVENKVTGNTLLINKALKSLYKESKGCIMHDWYLALIAYVYGKLEFIDKPLVMYRQHSDNVLGAKKQSFLDKDVRTKIRENYKLMFMQAFSVLELNRNKIKQEDKEVLEVFIKLENFNRFKKIYYILKYKFFKIRPVDTLTQMINI